MLRVRRKVLQQLLPGPRKAEACFSPAAFPSSQRRGGCATKKMPRSHRSGADGVVRPAVLDFAELLLRLRPIGLALRATPAPRATPPLRGGEFLKPHTNLRGRIPDACLSSPRSPD